MFRFVDSELKKNKMTRGDLAVALGITPSTLSLKLNGKSIIPLTQALQIKATLKTEMPLEALFATDEPKSA